MEEFKGTKGKWELKEQFDSPITVSDVENNFAWLSLGTYIFGDKKLIGEVRYSTAKNGYPAVDVLKEAEANAKLIAAAPELLKALKMCYASLCTYGSHPIIENNVEEAINKALNGQ